MNFIDIVRGIPNEFVGAYEKGMLQSYFFGNKRIEVKLRECGDPNENLFTLATLALKELFCGNGLFFDPQSRDLQCHLHALNISRICLWPAQ